MKKIIVGFLVTIVLYSCSKSKKELDPNRYFNGSVSGTRNGLDWKPRLGVVYFGSANKKQITLYFSDINTEPFDKTILENIKTLSGSYPLISFWTWRISRNKDTFTLPYIYYNGSFNEGQNIKSSPYLSKDVEAILLIEFCDTINNLVKGKLEASFRRSDSAGLGGVDSVVYRNVSFTAPIHPYTQFYSAL